MTLLHYYQSSNNVGKMYEFMRLKIFVVLDQLDQETGKCASEFTWQLIYGWDMNVVAVNDNSRTRIEDFVAGINAFFDLVLCPGSLFGHGLQKEICT